MAFTGNSLYNGIILCIVVTGLMPVVHCNVCYYPIKSVTELVHVRFLKVQILTTHMYIKMARGFVKSAQSHFYD